MNPLHITDGYKLGHRPQYPDGTNIVYTNLTARQSRIQEIDYIVFFGLQYFCLHYLLDFFNTNFFEKNEDEVIKIYNRRINNYLGPNNIGENHIRALHKLGYLPIRIKAVKEGTKIPIGLPCLTVVNTKPEFFWLTNYIETFLSAVIWKPCTTATLASRYRTVFNEYAKGTGADTNFIQFQGHDFSARGMSGVEDMMLAGAGHLLSFTGTDSIPAIDFLEEYYGADSDKELVGCSVPATEHSVMCMGAKYIEVDGKTVVDEYDSFKRLITEIYPTGVVSIVSDSFDYWGIINDILPRLKNEILARDGKVVIRPDSGDPTLIVCGDPNAKTEWERKGSIQCLWELFGGTVNAGKAGKDWNERHAPEYKQLDPHIGLIYGDSITLDRQFEILRQLTIKGFSSTNMVFGIGSYTYQYVTRDTFGFALKATYGEVNGKGYNIFKAPKTDVGGLKKSHKGLLRLNADMTLDQECTWEEEAGGIYETVFEDGKLVRTQTLAEIRAILNG